jgi:hypothetical protein
VSTLAQKPLNVTDLTTLYAMPGGALNSLNLDADVLRELSDHRASACTCLPPSV